MDKIDEVQETYQFAMRKALEQIQRIIIYAVNERNSRMLAHVATVLTTMFKQASEVLDDGSYLKLGDEDDKNLQ